jgi:hypothetical protein
VSANDVPKQTAGWLGWSGVALVTLAGVLSATIECLLVPFYVGSVPIPVAVVLAVLLNWFLPRIGRALVPSAWGSGLPMLGWLAVVIVFGVLVRPEGDVILPGGSLQLVTYGLVLLGAVAGVISAVTSAPLPPPRTPRSDQPTTPRSMPRSAPRSAPTQTPAKGRRLSR